MGRQEQIEDINPGIVGMTSTRRDFIVNELVYLLSVTDEDCAPRRASNAALSSPGASNRSESSPVKMTFKAKFLIEGYREAVTIVMVAAAQKRKWRCNPPEFLQILAHREAA
jgi:hypothetical protein